MSTDYSEWTETEVSAQDYCDLPEKRRGMDIRWRRGIRTATYFRLDPPAPKYREGEMRWLTDEAAGSRFFARRIQGGWDYNHPTSPEYGDVVIWTDDEVHRSNFTLSEPVVVVPAPTDAERAAIERNYGDMGEESLVGSPGGWLVRVVPALREQEAIR